MLFLPALLTTLSATIVSVSAHGYVQQVIIGGQYYTGWRPQTDPFRNPVPERVVRHFTSLPGYPGSPFVDATSQDLACNKGGETGSALVADVDAGSNITFLWTPARACIVYLLSITGTNRWNRFCSGPGAIKVRCGGNCSTFSTVGAEWFKIEAEGYSNGEWAASKLMANNNSWTVTLPKTIASGQYLIRNEIIGLHNYTQPQYYPSCTQLNVKNGGNSKPAPFETVQIPGLYNGVKFPNLYTDVVIEFPAPGPPVVSFASDNSGNNNPGGSGSCSCPVSSSSRPSPSPSSSQPSLPSLIFSSSTSYSAPAPSPSSPKSSQCKAKRYESRMNHRRSSHSLA